MRVIRLSDGAVEYLTLNVVETSGKDISTDTVQVSLGTYDAPGTWRTPDVKTGGTDGTLTVKLLVGGSYVPAAGDYYAWTRIVDVPETIPVRCDDQRVQIA